MTKNRNYYHEISDEDEKKMAEIEQGQGEFKKNKVVKSNTPFVYLSPIVAAQIAADEEIEEKPTLAGSVNLFLTDRNKFTVLLEKAGYTVESLPASI